MTSNHQSYSAQEDVGYGIYDSAKFICASFEDLKGESNYNGVRVHDFDDNFEDVRLQVAIRDERSDIDNSVASESPRYSDSSSHKGVL